MKERLANRFLQALDTPGQRRRAKVACLAGMAKMQFVREDEKVFNLVKVQIEISLSTI